MSSDLERSEKTFGSPVCVVETLYHASYFKHQSAIMFRSVLHASSVRSAPELPAVPALALLWPLVISYHVARVDLILYVVLEQHIFKSLCWSVSGTWGWQAVLGGGTCLICHI